MNHLVSIYLISAVEDTNIKKITNLQFVMFVTGMSPVKYSKNAEV